MHFRPSFIHIITTILKHEALRFYRRPGFLINMLTFFLASILVFHLTVGPFQIKEHMALGYLLVTIYLAMLLAADSLYREDMQSGFLEQYILTGVSPLAIILAKIAMQMLYNGIFILIGLPIAFIIMQIDLGSLPYFYIIGLTFITYNAIVMNFIESLLAKGAMQKLLLNLPFTAVVLILSALSLQQEQYFFLLLALLLLMTPFFLWATTQSLKG